MVIRTGKCLCSLLSFIHNLALTGTVAGVSENFLIRWTTQLNHTSSICLISQIFSVYLCQLSPLLPLLWTGMFYGYLFIWRDLINSLLLKYIGVLDLKLLPPLLRFASLSIFSPSVEALAKLMNKLDIPVSASWKQGTFLINMLAMNHTKYKCTQCILGVSQLVSASAFDP